MLYRTPPPILVPALSQIASLRRAARRHQAVCQIRSKSRYFSLTDCRKPLTAFQRSEYRWASTLRAGPISERVYKGGGDFETSPASFGLEPYLALIGLGWTTSGVERSLNFNAVKKRGARGRRAEVWRAVSCGPFDLVLPVAPLPAGVGVQIHPVSMNTPINF